MCQLKRLGREAGRASGFGYVVCEYVHCPSVFKNVKKRMPPLVRGGGVALVSDSG